jgi:hypothetical protein
MKVLVEEDEKKGRRWIKRAPADISEASYECSPNTDTGAAILSLGPLRC